MSLDVNRFRPWLMLLARTRMDGVLRSKIDPSDIVQQTLLLATRDAPQFRGQTDAELAGWLRSILGHVLSHEVRSCSALKRDVGLQVSVQSLLEASAQRLDDFLATTQTSPSQAVIFDEERLRLAGALERLAPDYCEVLVLRHIEGLSFPMIAERMNRNAGAVRMLWVRALAQLKDAMGDQGSFPAS